MKKKTLYTILLFGLIFGFILWLTVTQIEEFQLQDDPKLKQLKEKIKPLFSKDKKYDGILSSMNNRNLLNEISLYKGDKSYTINKHKIFLCLKDEKNEYYDDNILLFVLLHECAHVLCNSVGHTDEFNQIFDALLEEAAEVGIIPEKFQPPSDYCTYND
jgi:hypothetical protein